MPHGQNPTRSTFHTGESTKSCNAPWPKTNHQLVGIHISYRKINQEHQEAPTAAAQHEMLRHKAAAGSVSRQQDPAAGSCSLLPLTSRRGALVSLVALLPFAQASVPHPAAAAAAAQEEPACASCVGYVEGTLGSCSAVGAPCSSSYDDRPQHFVAPWTYDGSREAAIDRLVDQLQVRLHVRGGPLAFGWV